MIITNVQRMSMNDGPGIRTTVFVKGCPLRCKWCHNPECIDKEETPCFTQSFKDSFLYNNDGEAFCERLARDKSFFEATGGGVTLSGGEPLLYPDFVQELGKGLSKRGISLAVDTCGFVPWSSLEQALPVTEIFLYDLKAADSSLHEKLTGQRNEPIWENLYRLLEHSVKIMIRIPVIGGGNEKEVKEIISRIPAHKNIVSVELLPYHKYGIGKYEKAGIKYRGEGFQIPEDGYFMEAETLLKQKGIVCMLQGRDLNK